MRSSRSPASARAVAAASSSRGWRWRRCAASAPANPDAPATRTRASATERASDPGQGGLDRGTSLGGLRVGERAVRRPELQAQGEALLPLADLLAAEQVEDVRASKQVSPALHDGGANARGRHLLIDHDRQVLV